MISVPRAGIVYVTGAGVQQPAAMYYKAWRTNYCDEGGIARAWFDWLMPRRTMQSSFGQILRRGKMTSFQFT